ncbi:MAG TPA: sigma-54 dependent transcriptional regulator [Longimicrobiales bacterium]|nr:sigma-54 dependent transcriptional regulator [Longimicrobiales bacterium]
MKPKILVVDDEASILNTLQILLKGEGFEVHTASTAGAGLELLDDVGPDLVLSDIRMPGKSGLELLDEVRERDGEIPVILMTAQASLQSAVQAVNQGAYYYLQKPFSNDELVALCRRAFETRVLKKENRALKREIQRRDGRAADRPIGRNRAFVEILKLAETVAPTDSTVLITGESGTGKEVLARYLHALSERAEGPFVSINCAALPENLLESELFGHVKGSFTGAVRDKDGLLVAARGGTFFLDEIGEMTPQLQVKLLRALQEREVVPVGATVPVDIDVRIVAATNRDLEQEIRSGGFRSDLYYRLNVISMHLPALRDRKDDIPLLTDHFLAEMSGEEAAPAIAEDAMTLLTAYDWPGNVRELENALERSFVLTRNGSIDGNSLPERIVQPPAAPIVSDRPAANPTLEVIEKAYILWVLDAEGGNKAKAAEILGIDPSTLYRKLNRYGV